MGTILIVYSSRADETKGIAELIAEGARQSGHQVVVKTAEQINNKDDLAGFDAYIFGSPTYHGEMLPAMKQVLFMAENAQLKGKPGGAFGAYGWSGEANKRIFDTMTYIFKMRTAPGPLMIKASWVEDGVETAQAYGKEIAGMI
ncbi:flavodoxin domain-containing protein [Desulfobacter latus]|uniref:NAD(P)H-dependent oxidoreductase n=1 Tax=Desulfobacter latus TaxID=2292 RepID=A0A850T4X2_9BACT|nr:flavodoxin domain-containing protein [Desulfobacter latus]NWH03915.1 NAD(P)H-dependent oxidoreductase [Desulfobacter latus]